MSSFNENTGLGYLKTQAIELVKYPYQCYIIQRKTFERTDRTKERNKTDIRATTCNPFE